MKKKISIICPVYNEEDCIPPFFERIKKLKNKLSNYEIKLIFSNNCSTDQSYKILKQLCKENEWTNLITLTRNFGYQSSVYGALKETKSDLYFIVDVDLQDPPELLEDLLDKYEMEDYQVVFGERSDRNENRIIKSMRNIYYRILKKIADQDFQVDMAEYFLITDEVKNVILKTSSSNIFLRNEVAYSGYKRIGIPYKREKRQQGQGEGESLLYMILFGFKGIVSSSTFPLRIIFYAFLPMIFLNLLFIFNITSLKFIIAINLSFIVYAFAFVSIYIARIYKDSMLRPIYIIDKKKTFLKND